MRRKVIGKFPVVNHKSGQIPKIVCGIGNSPVQRGMLKRTADDEIDTSMSRGDYVQFRDKWMKHVIGKGWLPEKHRLIGARIALYANFEEQYARPSVATIAIDTNSGVRTVVRAIANLEKEGLLRIERRKRGVNRYFLIF